ncbi:MAG: DUF4465 domain-containing protein [Paludibacter sp.]|nr:DUF4465 domain-containing protein [Paludibacter sp.]
MKKNSLFLVVVAFALLVVSCKNESEVTTKIIGFEDVTLNSDSIWDGSDKSGTAVSESAFDSQITNYYGSFVSDSIEFKNVYTAEWFSWSGFACSAKIDTVTYGQTNQYSSITGSGAMNSTKYAVAYDSASVICPTNAMKTFKIKNMMLTNSTWGYIAMLNGSGFGHKFSQLSDEGNGDWFKVIIKGYLSSVVTGSVDYYLADFRDGKSFISNEWIKVDVSSLGEVDRVSFTFDSSDKAFGFINNPTYVCVDNIEFEQTVEDVK